MKSGYYICFDCKTIKPVIWVPSSDYEHRKPNDVCPRCRKTMKNISASHKIPQAKNAKGWDRLEKLEWPSSIKSRGLIRCGRCKAYGTVKAKDNFFGVFKEVFSGILECKFCRNRQIKEEE